MSAQPNDQPIIKNNTPDQSTEILSEPVTFKKRNRPTSNKRKTLDIDTTEEKEILFNKTKISKPNLLISSSKDIVSTSRETYDLFTYKSNKSVIPSLDLQSNAVAEGFIDSNTTTTTTLSNTPIFISDGKIFQTDNGKVINGDDAELIDDQLTYTGLASYKPKIAAREKLKIGPSKLPANVRTMSRVDYQPDICKDYKETGYCGYGDSCKFMHDRGDYKSGWEIDQEWDKEQNERKKKLQMGFVEVVDESSKKEPELPFACFICRNEFVKPVVTKCNHYFCEKCALQRYVKDTKCAACKQQTLGIFNTAYDIIAKLQEKKKKEEELQNLVKTGQATTFTPAPLVDEK